MSEKSRQTNEEVEDEDSWSEPDDIEIIYWTSRPEDWLDRALTFNRRLREHYGWGSDT